MILLPRPGDAAIHRRHTFPIDDDQKILGRGDPDIGRRIAEHPQPEIGLSHRKTVQHQFAGSIAWQLLDRDELAHSAVSSCNSLARLTASSRWPNGTPAEY